MREKIDTNYARPQIPGRWMKVTNYQWKDKASDEIWKMQILEGLSLNWDKHTNERLVDKGFEPTTEDEIRQFIITVYEQVLLGGKGKI